MKELQEFIFPEFHSEIYPVRQNTNFRYAPSIIARGEAEIFNVSIPRFTIRIYINEKNNSFINARRIGILSDQARDWAIRRTDSQTDVRKARRKLYKNSPAWILRKCTCIGDSVLNPQNLFSYYILRAELGEVNGEGKKVFGTPYLKHIPLTGGLCAQAVCFIATSLLRQFAGGVYCVADITALAWQNANTSAELKLQGLTHREIAYYFSNSPVGLRAIWQRPAPWYYDPSSNSEYNQRRLVPSQRNEALVRILRSYLLSNMPVIMTVDAGRQAGIGSTKCPIVYKSIFEENQLEKGIHLSDPYQIRRRNHAIILVGCGLELDNQNSFLFNDTSRFPFMKAVSEQFFDASCYIDEDMKGLCDAWFLPVTPSQVRLPLGDWQPTSKLRLGPETSSNPGLIKLAQYFQIGFTDSDLPSFPLPYDPGQFRLTRLCDIPENVMLNKIQDFTAHKEKLAAWCEEKSQQIAKNGHHWCWLQYNTQANWKGKNVSSIWIWDAEKEPLDTDTLEDNILQKYLLGTFAWRAHEFENFRPLHIAPKRSCKSETKEKESSDHVKVKLRRSIITSFSVDGIKDSLSMWPKDVRYCDYYAFMQKDANQLLKSWLLVPEKLRQFFRYTMWAKLFNLGRLSPIHTYRSGGRLRFNLKPKKQVGVPWPIVNAQDRMAMFSTHHNAIKRCASRLHQSLNGVDEDIKILAIASFLQGLASQTQKAEKARSALTFLIKMARELQQFGHPSRTVEIVAGSLFEGTWRGKRHALSKHTKTETVYVANLVRREEAINSLLANLRLVIRQAEIGNVQIAIELEPGPYFVVNSFPVLEDLCKQLQGDSIFSCVGLNLDIAHWSISGITPDKVRKSDIVRKRIVHCHIADHGKGHFSDVAIGRIHDFTYFKEWVDLLGFISKELREKSFPGFSGGIAIELEACKDKEYLEESVTFLNKLVEDPPKKVSPYKGLQHKGEFDIIGLDAQSKQKSEKPAPDR
ncbi:MAG: TIM barrel protein [Sedimentisphaerales bacterium]